MSGGQEWRLLHIDDDEDDYFLTRSMLSQFQSRKVKLEWASTYDAGYQKLCSAAYDAVLIDYDLGLRTGIELIREFVAREYPGPFILYTGRGSFEVDVEAMQAGATLYVTKTEATPLLLERSIRYAIERKQIEHELRVSNERLTASNEQLAHELAERKRAEQQLETAHAEVVSERNRLQAVMETLPLGVAIVDAQGGHIQANLAYEKVWGGPRPDTHTVADYDAYRAWWADSDQPVQPEEWASARAVQKGETVVGQIIQIERFDGSRAFVHNSGAPVLDAQGRIVGSAVAILDITEQKRLEAAVRYQADIANAAGDAIIGTDIDFKINFWNRSAEKLYGWRPEEVAGKTPSEVLHIEYLSDMDRDEAQRQLFQAGYWEGTASTTRKDGSRISVVACTTILRDRMGNMIGAVGSHHDITELKRVEQALRESEERYRVAGMNIPAVYAQTDHELRYRWIHNPHPDFCVSDIIGKRDDELDDNEETRRLVALKRKVFESGVGLREELIFHRTDGIHTYDMTLEPLRDVQGRIVGVTTAALDTTERRRMEEQLRESEQNFLIHQTRKSGAQVGEDPRHSSPQRAA